MSATLTAALLDDVRLAAVRRYEILDAPVAGEFDAFTRAAATVCGTPIATVSIVDADRVWFAASRGLRGVTQVGVEPGLCASAFRAGGPYVVNDAAADPRTRDHPLVRGGPRLRFYAAAPIVTADGQHLGTVTAMDTAPRQPTELQMTVLGHLAGIVAQHLDLRLAMLTAVRAERRMREQAVRRAASAAAIAGRVRDTAEAHRAAARPAWCQLGGAGRQCPEPAEVKIADPWGDSAWGCAAHVEEAIVTVRTVFLASAELGGLAAYADRP
ncbi:GAF domain-containing protein [Actinoplanes sp. NPDC049599]|uniref:GAF domain-containing protein n=1 Tax=Actinoplanes sp. NPDC049599 TaxID=3363903 RepID=UPI0037A8CEF4